MIIQDSVKKFVGEEFKVCPSIEQLRNSSLLCGLRYPGLSVDSLERAWWWALGSVICQTEIVVYSYSPDEESVMIHEGVEEIVGVEFEVCPGDAGLRLFRGLAGACLVAGDRGEVSESPPKTPKLGTQEVDEAGAECDAGDVHRCFEEGQHQLQNEYRVVDSCGHLQWHGDRNEESFVHQGNIDPEGFGDIYEAQVDREDY